MQFEETYSDDRLVTCENPPCSFDDDLELHIVSYGLTEVAEWECPACGSMNDYTNNRAFDLADNYRDMMKDERAWQ